VVEIALAALAGKVAVVAPFTTTRPAGVVRLGLLVLIVSTLQPTEGLFRVTVHVLDAPPTKLEGVQLVELGVTAATRLMVTFAELAPRAAVTMAVWLLDTVVVLALKVAEVAVAATVTDAGTVRVELVLARVTLAPPAGAALVSVTVQVLDALAPRLVGLQASEEINTGATRLTEVLAELLL
jgi:hypothetical protein